jgi:predicted RNase H-like HicB family nuclease
MSVDRAYRILITFDSEQGTFLARIPELDLEATGASRAEAIAALESALEQRVAAAVEEKRPLPPPIDVTHPNETITVSLGAPLHKELLFHAKQSRMRVDELATQLLARAIGSLDGGRPRRRPDNEARADEAGGEMRDSNRPSRPPRDRDDRDDDRGNRRGRDRKREGYRPELEDKANFLEYLRGLEKGGGPQGGGRGRR